jgi:hypothetical protein
MKKKVILLVIILVLLALLGTGVIFFLRSRQSAELPTETITSDFVAPQEWSDLLIATNISDWLETKMRDERGAYNTFYNCEWNSEAGEAVCDNGQSSNRSGFAVIWANYQLWKKTGDPDTLTKIKNALAVYDNRELVGLIQTHDLACYHLLPIYFDTSTAFDTTDRERITRICERTAHEGSYEPYFIAPPEDNYLSMVQNSVTNIISGQKADSSNVPTFTTVSNIEIAPSFNWVNFASDLMAVGQITQEPDFVTARTYFAGAVNVYSQISAPTPEEDCQLLLASQELCKNDPILGETACRLEEYLKPLVLDESRYTDLPTVESLAKCALALPADRDFFVDKIKNYYYSLDNVNAQYGQPWLLNVYGSRTKSVVPNALFAGLLAGE